MVRVQNAATVRAPVATVQAIYADYAGWPRIFPAITSVRLLRRQGPTLVLAIDHVEGPVINELTVTDSRRDQTGGGQTALRSPTWSTAEQHRAGLHRYQKGQLMRVLLAGATGVIGQQLAPVLVAAGHEVFRPGAQDLDRRGLPLR